MPLEPKGRQPKRKMQGSNFVSKGHYECK